MKATLEAAKISKERTHVHLAQFLPIEFLTVVRIKNKFGFRVMLSKPIFSPMPSNFECFPLRYKTSKQCGNPPS